MGCGEHELSPPYTLAAARRVDIFTLWWRGLEVTSG